MWKRYNVPEVSVVRNRPDSPDNGREGIKLQELRDCEPANGKNETGLQKFEFAL